MSVIDVLKCAATIRKSLWQSAFSEITGEKSGDFSVKFLSFLSAKPL
jgi:hypothetical protein